MTIRNTFKELIRQHGDEAVRLEKISFRYSTVRIVSFLTALLLFVYFANAREGELVAFVVISFPLAFGLLVKSHNRISERLKLERDLKKINEEELQRCDHELEGLPDGGNWLDRRHPYAYDLDIFGQNSLFQLLNRTGTPSGEKHLAGWLMNASDMEDIQKRQEAVKELAADMHWNQRFQAAGRMLDANEQSDLDRLITWISSPAKLPSLPYRVFSLINPAIIMFTGIMTIMGHLTIYIPLVFLLVNGFILRKFQDRLTRVTHSTSGNASLLRSYASLIGMIEKRTFSSKMLNALQSPFLSSGSATGKINKLRRLADYLNARGNLFYQLLNFAFLIDIHLINAAEKWKKHNRDDISMWFSNIGEVEALISLAGFRISQPDYCNPLLTEEFSLEFSSLGHPLIHPSERVVNDFQMNEIGQVLIVTGSNMSGKSTFLRTVGINAVLAYAGAVTCSSMARLSVLHVFTGMRTEDNLEEHISSFYAELKRIRQLLDYIAASRRPVLYMLDEVLKGTNTEDRHKGSEALIEKLSGKNAVGFVSTHDLELGRLAEKNHSIENYSFNSRIENNEIIFDYRITKGICHSFNASMLMKKIGILDDK